MTKLERLKAALMAMPPDHRIEQLLALPGNVRSGLLLDFTTWGHSGQLPPPGDWRVWLMCAGRGFGKTRAGAEWVAAQARANPHAAIALVAATWADGRRVMIDGPAGLLAVAGNDGQPRWAEERGELAFPSGAKAALAQRG